MHSKKPLKIFVDGYLLNKEPQGTVTYIRELYKEVAKANTSTLFYLGIFQDEHVINEFAGLDNIKFIFFKHPSRLVRMLYEIPRLIKKHGFEYAHFQYVIPFVRSEKCKYIVTIHDILFNEFPNFFSPLYRIKRNFLFKNSAKKSDFLLTVSTYSQQSIIKRYKLRKEKVLITPNGVNQHYFKGYSKEKAIEYIYKKYGIKNYLLYVSRVEPRKNQELLLNSFLNLKLHTKGYELIFIGKNTISNSFFETKLSSLDELEQSKIHYFEEIVQTDLSYFYQAAQIFIFPSKAEGFGIPPIEAAALEIPVICSNTTAMSDFDFFKPYFFDPNDILNFEKLLTKRIENKEIVDKKAIQKIIKNKYSWVKSAAVITTIISK